jgi:hypothetical protein
MRLVRQFRLAERSFRLPFVQGCPVPIIRLRGVRYAHVVSRRDFAVRRGWIAREEGGPVCGSDHLARVSPLW